MHDVPLFLVPGAHWHFQLVLSGAHIENERVASTQLVVSNCTRRKYVIHDDAVAVGVHERGVVSEDLHGLQISGSD